MSDTTENGIHSLENVTVREFLEFAEKNNLMDHKILIQFRDDGGDYSGCDECLYCYPEVFSDDEKYLIL